MKSVEFFWKYTKAYKKNIFLGSLFSFLSVIFVLILPQISQLFIDSVYTSSSTDSGNLGAIWNSFIAIFNSATTTDIVLFLIISFIIVAILQNVFKFLSTQQFFKLSSESCGDIRKDGFKKLAFADKTISRNQTFFNFTTDIDDFYDIMYSHYPKMLENGIKIFIASILALIINWKIAIAFIIFVPIILRVSTIINLKILRGFSEARNRKSDMITESEDLIDNIREIKTFGNEEWAKKEYEKFNNEHNTSIVNSTYTLQKFNIWMNILRAVGLCVALTLSVIATINGTISIGYFVLIMSYAFIIFDSTINLINSNHDAKIALVGVARLQKFLQTKFNIKENKKLKITNPEIRFLNVNLDLNGKEIFKNLSFRLPYGKSYAIHTSQGQGKTALARLLLRFVSHNSGKIYFNNKQYENYNIQSLRKCFGYVPQEPVIFEGTIDENIAMFSEIEKEKINKIIKFCELDKLINSLPQKEKTILYANGSNLTTQYCQRIAIARALYRDAPILLLDSSFNKFPEEETEKLIKKILKMYKDKTVIFLTDNLEQTTHFDKVLEFNDLVGGKK